MRVALGLIVVVSMVVLAYGDSCYCPPFSYGWVCTASRSLWDWDSSATVTYSVSVGGNAGTLVCAQGYSASAGRFMGLGCGHGSFSRTLAWGNIIGMPKIKCSGNPFGAGINWNF